MTWAGRTADWLTRTRRLDRAKLLHWQRVFFCQSLTRSKREKSKTGKIDEHIDAAGIDNMESFIDPSTNLIYYKLKILGKGGFAKGKFYH